MRATQDAEGNIRKCNMRVRPRIKWNVRLNNEATVDFCVQIQGLHQHTRASPELLESRLVKQLGRARNRCGVTEDTKLYRQLLQEHQQRLSQNA